MLNCEACKESRLPDFVPYTVWLKEKELHHNQVKSLILALVLCVFSALCYVGFDRYQDGNAIKHNYSVQTTEGDVHNGD